MSLVQGTSDTSLVLKLSGVPIGSEEETEKNLDVFYIRSLKQMVSPSTFFLAHENPF